MPRLTAIRKRALDEMMKEGLFEAAVSVLAEHGVDGMTMDRVAVAAGIAKGSVYNYFRSKRELLDFIYTRTIAPIFQNLLEIAATDLSPREKLSTHLRQVIEHLARYAQVFRLLFEDETAHGLLRNLQQTTQATGHERLAEIFRQGTREGVFRPLNPQMLVLMFTGLCRGVFEGRPNMETREHREDIHRLIMDVFLNGIAAERTPDD